MRSCHIAKPGKRRRLFWTCLCVCGKKVVVSASALVGGGTRSCGCLYKDSPLHYTGKTHGLSKTRSYRAWTAMRQRCTDSASPGFKNYGGRGIRICPSWESFLRFRSDMGECPPGLSLDRVDNNGDYKPSNCRWATRKQQNENRRNNVFLSVFGRTQTMSCWAKEFSVSPSLLSNRLKRGFRDPQELFKKPRLRGAL